jgi:hypothetical protein
MQRVTNRHVFFIFVFVYVGRVLLGFNECGLLILFHVGLVPLPFYSPPLFQDIFILSGKSQVGEASRVNRLLSGEHAQ